MNDEHAADQLEADEAFKKTCDANGLDQTKTDDFLSELMRAPQLARQSGSAAACGRKCVACSLEGGVHERGCQSSENLNKKRSCSDPYIDGYEPLYHY